MVDERVALNSSVMSILCLYLTQDLSVFMCYLTLWSTIGTMLYCFFGAVVDYVAI